MLTCSCGRQFKFEYQIANHIGMFILLNDNADNHCRVEQYAAHVIDYKLYIAFDKRAV